jgi:hypothetical protein
VKTELKGVFEDANKQVYFETGTSALEKRCPSSSRGASPCWGAVEFWSSPSHNPRSIWNYTLYYDGAIGSRASVDTARNPIQVYTIPLQHAVDAAIARTENKQLLNNIQQYPFTDSTEAEKKKADQENYEALVYSFLAFAFFLGLCGITYHLTGHITKQREEGMLQLIDAMMPNNRYQCLAARLLSVHVVCHPLLEPS